MKALLLAGGYGKRLGKLGEEKPKALLEIRPGVTALDYIIASLKKCGVEEFKNAKNFIIVTNKKFEKSIREWAKKKGFEGKIIVEAHERDEEKYGSIGGLYRSLKDNKIDDDLSVIATDNVAEKYPELLSKMHKTFNGEKFVIGIKKLGREKIRKRFGCVEIDKNGKVVSFEEKPENPKSDFISTAIYIFPKRINGKTLVEVLREYLKDGSPDAPGYFISWLVKNGYPVFGVELEGFWKDIGKPEDLEETREFFAKLKKIINE